jgi:alpha-beta hydrolase superfamily lysophospholipase
MFLSLYKTVGEKVRRLSAEVMDEMRLLMDKYKDEELSIKVIGHSLGAVLALLVTDEVVASILDAPPVAVVSFGGQKVGITAFVLKNSGKVNAPTGPTRRMRQLPTLQIKFNGGCLPSDCLWS